MMAAMGTDRSLIVIVMVIIGDRISVEFKLKLTPLLNLCILLGLFLR